MNIKRRHKGFSLIEVMISLVILAVGVLGLSKLQATLIKSGSDANQRTVATSIAQRKIDDLKGFTKLTVGTATDAVPDTWTSGIAANLLSFEHIADNEGGAASGTTNLTASTFTVGNYTYTLSWDVTDYYYTGTPTVATTPVAAGNDIDFKRIEVNVAWTDETGTAQSVDLDTVIDAYAPALTALADNTSTGATPPQASYTPEQAPDVIDTDVDTGDGLKRQTSKPLPDAVSQGGDSNTVVTFDVVTYHEDPDNSGEFIADRIEGFKSVDCTCQFSSVNANAATPAHVVWDDEENTRVDTEGTYISKPTATQTSNAAAVDDICSICCQDHHDDTASPVKYVPGTTTGNHVHYQADGTTVAVQADGDTYVESCRFKLIDGVYRVFQDWQLYDNISVLRAELADGQSLQTTYSTYVENYILAEVNGDTLPAKPDTETDLGETGKEIEEGEAFQLESRGIYIDKVYDSSGNENPSTYTSYMADTANLDRLEKIPFAEVNLTLLANWSTSDATKATVDNEPVATIDDPVNDYYGTYSRGFVTTVDDPSVVITSTISDNNNGLTQIVDASNTDIADGIDITISPAGTTPTTPFTVSGTYAIAYPNGTTGATVSISPSSNCSLPGTPGDTFTCSLLSPSTETIQITASKTTGSPSLRCSGSSIAYSVSGISTDTTHNFASFDCD